MSVEIPYRWGNGYDGSTLVDDDVVEIVGRRTLRRHGDYVFLGAVQLHRVVMGCVPRDGLICHHINEDTTDNRRENIKLLRSKLEHGAEPHPWRDRFSSLVQRFGREAALGLLEVERACAGHRIEADVTLGYQVRPQGARQEVSV